MGNGLDRRQILRVALSGTAIGVAGCSGDESETTDEADTEEPDTPASETPGPMDESDTDSGSDSMVDGPAGVVGQFQVDSENTGFVADSAVPSSPSMAWQYPDSEYRTSTGIAYVDGTLYAGLTQQGRDRSQKLVAFNATSGEVLTEIETSSLMAPTYHDGALYITSDSGVKKLSPSDLSEQWTAGSRETFTSGEMTPDGDTIYGLGNNDANGNTLLRAISTGDGSKQWETAVTFSGFISKSTPAVDDNHVYVAGDSLNALAKGDGSEQWSASVDGGKFANPPTVVDGTVYVGTNNGRLLGYNATDGSTQVDIETQASFGIDSSLTRNGTYLMGTGSFNSFALNMDTNEMAWSRESSVASTATAAGDYFLAAATTDSPIVAINRSDGAVAWEAGPSLSSIQGGAVVYPVGGSVYAAINGRIIRLAAGST